MNSLHAREFLEILLRYPFQSLVVPWPCGPGSPYPAAFDCSHYNGTGKIMYGIADGEVV